MSNFESLECRRLLAAIAFEDLPELSEAPAPPIEVIVGPVYGRGAQSLTAVEWEVDLKDRFLYDGSGFGVHDGVVYALNADADEGIPLLPVGDDRYMMDLQETFYSIQGYRLQYAFTLDPVRLGYHRSKPEPAAPAPVEMKQPPLLIEVTTEPEPAAHLELEPVQPSQQTLDTVAELATPEPTPAPVAEPVLAAGFQSIDPVHALPTMRSVTTYLPEPAISLFSLLTLFENIQGSGLDEPIV